MLKRLKETGRLELTAFLIVVTAFCVLLSVSRVLFTGTAGYLFLNWNLLLAFLPWLLTSLAVLRRVTSRLAIMIIMGIWLLLFPNSLYILTDLIHLRLIDDAPVWLDLIVVLSFAWAGLCFGFISLMDIDFFLRERFHAGEKLVTGLTIIMLFFAALGIYIGRFLRWNTWDILGSPTGLWNDLFFRFSNPRRDLRIWAFTLLMGTLLNLMYFTLRFMNRKAAADSRRV